jgi:hypothetical protein
MKTRVHGDRQPHHQLGGLHLKLRYPGSVWIAVKLRAETGSSGLCGRGRHQKVPGMSAESRAHVV